MADGWAVEVDGAIKVRSIMDYRLGAMLNYLASEHGLRIVDGTPESKVQEIIAAASGGKAAVVEVTISRKLHA